MSQANFNPDMDMADFGDPAGFGTAEQFDAGGQFDGGGQFDDGSHEAMPMSQPLRKKGVNIYTLFLILSLIFLIAGSIFLLSLIHI